MPIKPNNIPSILIIDDEPFNLEFLSIILRQYGYNVFTAPNGKIGRITAEKELPDLILLDIMMPGESGFECAATLRLSNETAEIPIIFITALDDIRNISKGYDAGAIDFIIKPFDYKEVLHRIRLHLLLSKNEKVFFRGKKSSKTNEIMQESWLPEQHKKRSFYTSQDELSNNCFYEPIYLSKNKEGHLLISHTGSQSEARPDGNEISTQLLRLLAEFSGPLFSPQETVRNIGMELKNIFGDTTEFSGTYSVLDRDIEKLIVVNAGGLPAIHMPHQKRAQLIEPQSGNLGSLGLGIPPCSTCKFSRKDRLFMYSKDMLSHFENTGAAINRLRETCDQTGEDELEAACQAAGSMLKQQSKASAGILIAIEG